MGLAKYAEDNYSRFYGASIIRENKHERFVHRQNNKTNTPSDKKEANPTMPDPKLNSKMKDFALAKARPLPVIVLADASGSMAENGKIVALNQALQDMVRTFATESRVRAELQVGLITFGGSAAQLHLPLAPAHQITHIESIPASGKTPLGQAFELVKKLLEDKELIPSRAYRPAVILVSDGLPTDDWKGAFAALQASERAQKATRFAMAIGDDADEEMLRQFANDREAPVFKAHEARDIHRFFRAVSMSVTSRTVSSDPDESTGLSLNNLPVEDELDLDF